MHVCTQTFPTHLYNVYSLYILCYRDTNYKKSMSACMLVYFSSLEHGVIIAKMFTMNRQQFCSTDYTLNAWCVTPSWLYRYVW